jgi:hypothetical protein
MSKVHFGSLPARYSFFLNPYSDDRFSRCPKCQRLTNIRKFAFLIHIDPRGLFALRKASRYCPVCELIIVHQDELESQLIAILSQQDPSQVGKPYFVIGSFKMKAWKAGMQTPLAFKDIRKNTADFKYQLNFTPDLES